MHIMDMQNRESTIMLLIQNRVDECMAIASKKFNWPEGRGPSVHFDVKGMNGGEACYKTWSVHFNLEIAKTNLDHYLKQTVAHEVAHLVDYLQYKGWGHKRSWKMIMQHVFGLSPDRCHSYDTSEVKKKKYDTYTYICKCPGLEIKIKSNLHKKIQIQGRKFRCNHCATRIEFKEYFGKT